MNIYYVIGWLAHWLEYLDDPDRKIARPRQNYLGSEERSYIPMTQRNSSGKYSTEYVSPAEKRRVNGFAVTSKM
jgi:hypothetical protein